MNFDSDLFKNGTFTHIVADRPIDHLKLTNTDIVQPQWVCDSINNQILLPIRDYYPGQKLPAHLSPFVDFKEQRFVPERLKEIQKIKGEFEEFSVDEEE
jgi:pescadillo protein